MTNLKSYFMAVVVFVSFSVVTANTKIHEDILNVFNNGIINDSTSLASQAKMALDQKDFTRLIELGLEDEANFFSKYQTWGVYFWTQAYSSPDGITVIIQAVATLETNIGTRIASSTWTLCIGSPLTEDPDKNLTYEQLIKKYSRVVLYDMSRLSVNQIIVAKVYAAKNGLKYSPTFTSYESNFGMAWKIISEAADEYGKRNGVTTPYELYALGDNFDEVWKNRKTRKILQNLPDAVGKIVFN